MPFVPVPNTIAVDVVFTLDNQRVENTLYFEKGDGWTLPQIITFLDALSTLIQADLMPLLSAAIEFVELAARLLDTASSIGFSQSITPPVSGGNVAESLPNNVAYTISFRTGLTGRSFRGRNYVTGLPSDQVATNTVTAGLRTGLLDFYTSLISFASESDATWVVVSKYSGVGPGGVPIPRATGVTTPITSVGTYDNTVDSQRRRLPGRGS